MSAAPVISRTRLLGLIVAIIVFDQITKLYFHSQFRYGERVNVLPFFDWILTYNTGAAFSFLADAGGWQRWFFITLAFAVSAWCWRWIGNESDGRIRLALCLVIAGAIGNVIDRIWLGKVIDFVLIYWQPWDFYYPAFNVADSAICIGAAIMIWSTIFVRKDAATQ
ncbi:MAG: lipoprotein signal peptidase [Betaproteobacteria bacterium]|nr:MAG: lipoprotein signal peptidase [Betaproteobacteria bacterium]